MITEKDLHDAIAECKRTSNPNANTCLKLAAYYTILDHMPERKNEEREGYSFSGYTSESEFGKLAALIGIEKTMVVMEDLMNTLKIVNPRLHNGVLRKMNELQE